MEQRAYIVRITPLELTMRDVREGLADFACNFGFASVPDSFQILSIDPAPPPVTHGQPPTRSTVTRLVRRTP